MPSSKALLYLCSFIAEGLIVRDSAGRYSLGPYAVRLGLKGPYHASSVCPRRKRMPQAIPYDTETQ